MGILRAVVDSLGGSLADQWKDLITVDSFDELTVLSPGYLKRTNNNRGSNIRNSNHFTKSLIYKLKMEWK